MDETPTYWVFDLYKPWQDATVLPLELSAPDYSFAGFTVPSVSASAVRDASGHVHLALANLDPQHAVAMRVKLDGVTAHAASGSILTAAAMDAHNSFDAPDAVRPQHFTGERAAAGGVDLTLPAKSVVVLALD